MVKLPHMTYPPDQPCVRRFRSKREPGRTLHAILDSSLTSPGRADASPAEEWLQVSMLTFEEGASLGPHEHLTRSLSSVAESTRPGQEAWIVLRGSVNIRLYDEDRSLIEDTVLSAGHVLVTLHGAHAFRNAERGTVMVECKLGPYLGRDYTEFDGLS